MTFDATCLEGFDRRMQFLAMAVAIVRRTGRDMELERLFDDQEMDSLIMAVLVFVMEETLEENRDCTLEKISGFLERLLADVKPNFPNGRLRDLTEYIVKTVLKNDGEPRHYTLLHPEKGFQRVRVEFLADAKEETGTSFRIHYQLTDQAYDFLFRTKEVENELRFTMEELKLRELIRRKNYGKAIRQSAGLIQMIRQKKRELQQFLDRVRDNVLTIDVGDFESLYKSTFDLLADEYGTMREIRSMLLLAYDHLQAEMAIRDTLDVEMTKALSEMERIRRNLDLAVAEQQAMILERHTVSDMYAGIMKEAFSRRLLNRFDFEAEILKPMTRMDAASMNQVFQLLNPLFLPKPPKWLGIGAVYAPQQKLRTTEEALPGIVYDGLEEDLEGRRILLRNARHVDFTDGLLQYAAMHAEGFRLQALCGWMQARRAGADGDVRVVKDAGSPHVDTGSPQSEPGPSPAEPGSPTLDEERPGCDHGGAPTKSSIGSRACLASFWNCNTSPIEDRATLFQNVMRLYEAGIVDVAAWKAERPEVSENATGEFDLEYCLYQVEKNRPDLYGVRRMRLSWPDGALFQTSTRMESAGAVYESKGTISNILFEVEMEPKPAE